MCDFQLSDLLFVDGLEGLHVARVLGAGGVVDHGEVVVLVAELL